MASKIATSREGKLPSGRIFSLINEFDEYSSRVNGFYLTEEQKKLAFNTLTNDLSIAQGEGGTGKSTAMACVKYVCNRLDRPAYFVAVAGIAKKRVNDELERMCVIRKQNTNLFGESEYEVCSYTVRGLIRQIELTLNSPDIKGAIQLNDNPLIVFDESSMLDLSLVVEFLSLLDKHASR
ncbi:AAA family ATPase, partial [Vibrio sp. 10N.261.45.F1]